MGLFVKQNPSYSWRVEKGVLIIQHKAFNAKSTYYRMFNSDKENWGNFENSKLSKILLRIGEKLVELKTERKAKDNYSIKLESP